MTPPNDDQPREATIARLDHIDSRLSDVFSKLDENGKILSYINGDVKRSKSDILSINKRLRDIEDNELLQEGADKERSKMKTSTRNMLITVIMALGCLFAGIKVFQSSQGRLASLLQNNVSHIDRIESIEKSIDLINLIVEGGGE
mgnify:FL=1|jgi:hypothetical protein